jgi:cytochrome c-type biogenesis protein CcmH
LALHRAQLAELDRDLAGGQIAPADHATALLEVQRRMLTEAATTEAAPPRGSMIPLLVVLVAVPVVALLLYLPGASPYIPAAPLADRIAQAEKRSAEEARLIEDLRQRVTTLDPTSEQARQGYLLLGNVEDARGNLRDATTAWLKALGARFDPSLAARTAETLTRLNGGNVSKEAADLFRKALAQAPANAPWRPIVEQRLASAGPADPGTAGPGTPEPGSANPGTADPKAAKAPPP